MRPLIHIGYHKTATTWLQTRVFTTQMGFQQVMDHAAVNETLIAPHDLSFDTKQAAATLDNACKSAGEYLPVISSENLSGHPFYGGRASAEIAHRIKAASPDARILVTIRSQTTMLVSVYMQYLKRGGTLRPAQFFAGPDAIAYPGFEAAHFEYDRLIALYQSLFLDVYVVTFEALSAEPDHAISDLQTQLGLPPKKLGHAQRAPVSPSPGQQVAGLMRLSNQMRKSVLNPSPLIPIPGDWPYRAAIRLGRLMTPRRPIETLVRRTLAASYRDSNARLSKLTGGTLDLSAYP